MATFPPDLRRANLSAAGVDVGAQSHYVAVPEGRDRAGCDVRQFASFTTDLYALATWLTRCGIETVPVTSTGAGLNARGTDSGFTGAPDEAPAP